MSTVAKMGVAQLDFISKKTTTQLLLRYLLFSLFAEIPNKFVILENVKLVRTCLQPSVLGSTHQYTLLLWRYHGRPYMWHLDR